MKKLNQIRNELSTTQIIAIIFSAIAVVNIAVVKIIELL